MQQQQRGAVIMLHNQLSRLSGELLQYFARIVILGPESYGSDDYILLSQFWE
jgi:hypothetical protein